MSARASGRAAPLLLRLACGDITAARATLVVVNHLNGVAPSGAESAVDAALGGAISSRASAGALDSHFGASHFIPAGAAALPADSVLVVGLGEAGNLDSARLPEIGAAIVEAMVAVGARDAATIVHGAGGLELPPARAARLLAEGLMAAVQRPGGHEVREVTLVEFDDASLAAIRRGLRRAQRPPGLDVLIEEATLRLPAGAGDRGEIEDGAKPAPLRLGVTRAGERLKVTVISDAAFDVADTARYDREAALKMLSAVETRILRGGSAAARQRAMRELGRQLFHDFLGWVDFDLGARLRESRNADLVLRLDESTVDLPWELLLFGRGFVARECVFVRQREINAPGHMAAYVAPHEQLRALIVGDPTGDLAGARSEGEAVAEWLNGAGVDVRSLIGGLSRKELLRVIDDFNPDVFHYAGHARFDELRQQAGGLVLGDAVVTADDLAVRPHLPRLIFANACRSGQTGALTDQSLFDGAAPTHDFAGGLLRAGVRAFVGSQWPVDDLAALTFARSFYGAVAPSERGDTASTIGQAVQRARRLTAEEHGAAEPAWASYVIYGTPWAHAL